LAIYLLDTNILTALAQGDSKAVKHLQGLAADDEICTCFVVLGEWEYGILNAIGARKQARIRALGETIFAALTQVWDSTPSIALRYGAIQATLRAQGQMIPTNDVWIAAVALEKAATVVTTDPHFQRVPELSVTTWI
jgi:predicted nucleic acid-binding protein